MAGLVSSLEARVQGLEDRLAIIDLIASYGPAVDSGNSDGVAAIWAADGQYSFGVGDESGATLQGEQVPALVDIPGHQGYMQRGCGHILTSPRVRIHGDTAVATNHSLLVLHDGTRWVIERASANRWELERLEAGWRVRNRTNALLDGDPGAFGLFEA